ncbi:hypothetical protein [Streptomyces atroolivaceus]|uniref:hypothetical protein n=1 Tax=Streptomyces atroolivaceus TaxID=66869 RepID=UPI002024D96D|nr:hypothetical protein [Streptomyces atroolivaceus]
MSLCGPAYCLSRAGTSAESSRSEGNTWDGGGDGPPELTTTDPSTAEARRAADATLPRTSSLAPSGSAPGARMTPVDEGASEEQS